MNEITKMAKNGEECEVTVQFDDKTKIATVCVAEWPRFANRFLKIWGEPHRITKGGGKVKCGIWKVPMKFVRFKGEKSTKTTLPATTLARLAKLKSNRAAIAKGIAV